MVGLFAIIRMYRAEEVQTRPHASLPLVGRFALLSLHKHLGDNVVRAPLAKIAPLFDVAGVAIACLGANVRVLGWYRYRRPFQA